MYLLDRSVSESTDSFESEKSQPEEVSSLDERNKGAGTRRGEWGERMKVCYYF